METIMQNDEFREHKQFHQSFHPDCSSCWTERKEQREATSKLRSELGESLGQYRVADFINNPNPLG
jgi:hemerythrin